MTVSDRPKRFCEAPNCLGYDDHPRCNHTRRKEDYAPPIAEALALHPEAATNEYAIKLLSDPDQISRHMDCCAAAGCELARRTEAEYNGRRYDELTAHVEEIARQKRLADGVSV